MRKFELVVYGNGTATVKVGGKELADVTEIFFHGTPHNYTATVKQFERDENGKLIVDKDTHRIATKTQWFDFD